MILFFLNIDVNLQGDFNFLVLKEIKLSEI